MAKQEEVKKESPLQRMLNENMIPNILLGEVWNMSEEDASDVRDVLATIIKSLGDVRKAFDDGLVNQHKLGQFSTVENIRKPREDKKSTGENPLLSVFEV